MFLAPEIISILEDDVRAIAFGDNAAKDVVGQLPLGEPMLFGVLTIIQEWIETKGKELTRSINFRHTPKTHHEAKNDAAEKTELDWWDIEDEGEAGIELVDKATDEAKNIQVNDFFVCLASDC